MAEKKAAENKASLEDATKQGFLGTEVDPTPNENYTVAGVTKNAPTPENNAKAVSTAREAAGLTDADRDAGKK